jgi:nicotinic acid mononucleotide adenylyltransferase
MSEQYLRVKVVALIVVVACGSFSPPTYLHLRMFEMAKDEILETQTYEIMAGYYSPVYVSAHDHTHML